MFVRRLVDLCVDAEPVAHGRDLTEGHAGLRHSERTRIHPHKQNPFPAVAVAAQIQLVRAPGVIQRVVNVRDRRRKAQRVGRIAQALCRSDQRVVRLQRRVTGAKR
jgi:hypothetical protein